MSRASSIKACIAAADLTGAQKDQLIKGIQDIGFDSEQGKLIYSDSDVARLVDEQLEEALLAEQKKLYRKMKQLDAYVKIEESMNRALADGERKEPGWALVDSVLDADPTGYALRYGQSSIPVMAKTILNDVIAPAGKAYELFREKMFGATREPELQEKFARMIYDGVFDESELGQAAKAFADVIEGFRTMLNDAGADIPKRAGYLMQGEHKSSVMVKMGKKAWIDDVKKTATIYNPANDKPFKGDELDAALDIMYDNIVEGRADAPVIVYELDGQRISAAQRADRLEALRDKLTASKGDAPEIEKQIKMLEELKPQGVDGNYLGDAAVHQLRSQERTINFNTFDDWLKYNRRMGVDDIFAAMHSNLESMSNELAMMRTFGPDADAGFEYAIKKAAHHHPDKFNALNKMGLQKVRFIGKSYRVRAKWNVIKGSVNKGGGSGLVRFSQGMGNLVTAIRLPGASVAALLGDPPTGMVTAANIGISSARYLQNYVKQVSGGQTAALVHLSMGASSIINDLKSMNRFTEVTTEGWTAKAADMSTRLSGLQRLTKAGDEAMPITILQEMARNMDTPYDSLAEGWRKRFWEPFGLTKDDWEKVQKARDAMVYIDQQGLVTEAGKGAPVLNLRDLDVAMDAEDAKAIRQKLTYAIETMKEFAIIKGGTASRAFTTGGLEQGSVEGQAIRMITQLSTYPVQMVNTHLALARHYIVHDKSPKYLAMLAGATTVSGMIIIQTKAILAGRDPEKVWDEDDPTRTLEFSAEAFARGGGGGFYYDLTMALLQGEDGAAAQVAGPRISLMTQMASWVGNIYQGATDEKKGFDRVLAETVADMHGLSPTATHPATLIAHRLLVDSAIEAADASYAGDRRRRMERYFEREKGGEFWWRSGETTPDRAPDMTMGIGE